MIKANEAIRAARALIGTPYSELDCINLIKKVIRTAPGGVPSYTTAGTNTLWRSYEASAKYKDLVWRQEGIAGARAGMLVFKRSGSNVHHVGLVTGDGTVVHSSSVKGMVVETALDKSWYLLARHRYIETVDSRFDLNIEIMETGHVDPVGELGEPGPPGMTTPINTEDVAIENEGGQVAAYKMQVKLQDEDSTLNVRNSPDRSSERIGRLHHGAVVTVQAELDNGWRLISYGDGSTGYVDGTYLDAVETTEAEEDKTGSAAVTIVDSAGNHFCPVGDFKVLIGSVD